MQFLYPTFLWALAAVSIPIIIHLFNFRKYKRIVFSDIRFLKQVQEESKAKRKLREWLILACRVLCISLLVFAFAQPFIPAQENSVVAGQRVVSIFIDNSFSMNNEGSEGTLIETAKEKARAIVKAYNNTNQFQILSNELSGKQQRLLNKTDALLAIDEITTSPASAALQEIYQKQKTTFSEANPVAYYISDFQKSALQPELFKPDTTINIQLIPVAANQYSNVYVDSVWLFSPAVRVNEPCKLKIKISNAGNDDVENLAVNLTINNAKKGLVNVNCKANETQETEITFTPNTADWMSGTISISDHPITFDDTYYFTLKPISNNRILVINGYEQNKFIQSVYSVDEIYKMQSLSQEQIDYTAFRNCDLIILNEPKNISTGLSEELNKYVNEGGQLFIIPSEDAANINTFLTSLALPTLGKSEKSNLQLDKLNLQDELFKSVFSNVPQQMDLPTVQQYYPMQLAANLRGKKIIQLNNGLPFLWEKQSGKGRIFLSAVSLNPNWTTFVTHSLFVPVMLKIGQGISKQLPLAYTISRDKWILLPEWKEKNEAEKLVEISGNKTQLIADVQHKNGRNELFAGDELKQAGIYEAKSKSAQTQLAALAMNYARTESDLKTTSVDELEKLAARLGNASVKTATVDTLGYEISNERNGTVLWRIFAVLALLFLLAEIVLLKLK